MDLQSFQYCFLAAEQGPFTAYHSLPYGFLIDIRTSAPRIHRAPVPWEAGLHTIGSEGAGCLRGMQGKQFD
jgi:hypothetical protein